jgi:hypothetical protein
MIAQFAIGLVTGLFVGAAVFSHAFLRAVLLGAVAGAILGAIAVDGVDGYVRWVTYLPADITRLTAFWFWFGLIVGTIAGARMWAVRQMP